MRKFRVNVNGSAYEVEVEELGAAAVHSAPAPAPALAAAPAPKPAAPAPVAAPKPQAAPAGAGAVASPMPGVIKDVRVKVGDKVTPDTVVVILEAMKMENEIFAGVSGTVTAVHTSRDASVNTDEALVTIG